MAFTPYAPTPTASPTGATPGFTPYTPPTPAAILPAPRIGSAGQTVSGDLNSNLINPIRSAFSGAIDQIKGGAAQIVAGKENPIVAGTEGALKIGSGIANIPAALAAPITTPIAQKIGQGIDAVSNIPAVQRAASALPNLPYQRLAEDAGNLGNVAGALAGAKLDPNSGLGGVLAKTSKPVADLAGEGAAQVIGATTGAGASSIKEAAAGSPFFIEAMRGKISPEEIVQTAKDAVQTIADSRRSTYQAQLAKINDGAQHTHDFTPIQTAADKGLSDFGITRDAKGELNFDSSKFGSTADQTKVAQIMADVKNWGKDPAKQTTLGLDTLKQRIDNYITPDTKIGAFATSIKNTVRSELNNAPGYKQMTAGYTKASQLLDDIKSATGVGGKSNVDTVFTKLTTAMKADKQMRLDIIHSMENAGNKQNLSAMIGGSNMSSLVPKGLVGRGIDVTTAYQMLSNTFEPRYIPMLLATSPRIVGEFVNALGVSARAAKPILTAIKVAANAGSGAAATSAVLPQSTPAPATLPTPSQ